MSTSGVAQRLPRLWFRRQLAASLLPLLPLSWLFRLAVGVRRRLYGHGLLAAHRLPVPVVVVGNLTVGGSGKTPLVLCLVEQLRERGWKPGIISRGYRGRSAEVLSVTPQSLPTEVGDEPLLLARRSGVPVFVGRDRVAVGRALLAAHPECDIVVSDDGLQHYRLQRDVELAVFDGRGWGNGRMLPAGPLREPLSRLKKVDAVVWNTGERETVPPFSDAPPPQFSMQLRARFFERVQDARVRCTADDLRHRKLFAVAGIGDPSRFFGQLEALGLRCETRAFPDHHSYCEADLVFAASGVLLMTEKDAVKCAALQLSEAWALPVSAHLPAATDGRTLLDTILEKIDGRTPA